MFTARTYGIANLFPGEMELMIHRRLNTSDSQGPWPLNDNTTVSERVWLLADSAERSNMLAPRLRLALQYPFK